MFAGARHGDVEEAGFVGVGALFAVHMTGSKDDDGLELEALAAGDGKDGDFVFAWIVGLLVLAGAHPERGKARASECGGGKFTMSVGAAEDGDFRK